MQRSWNRDLGQEFLVHKWSYRNLLQTSWQRDLAQEIRIQRSCTSGHTRSWCRDPDTDFHIATWEGFWGGGGKSRNLDHPCRVQSREIVRWNFEWRSCMILNEIEGLWEIVRSEIERPEWFSWAIFESDGLEWDWGDLSDGLEWDWVLLSDGLEWDWVLLSDGLEWDWRDLSGSEIWKFLSCFWMFLKGFEWILSAIECYWMEIVEIEWILNGFWVLLSAYWVVIELVLSGNRVLLNGNWKILSGIEWNGLREIEEFWVEWLERDRGVLNAMVWVGSRSFWAFGGLLRSNWKV